MRITGSDGNARMRRTFIQVRAESLYVQFELLVFLHWFAVGVTNGREREHAPKSLCCVDARARARARAQADKVRRHASCFNLLGLGSIYGYGSFNTTSGRARNKPIAMCKRLVCMPCHIGLCLFGLRFVLGGDGVRYGIVKTTV